MSKSFFNIICNASICVMLTIVFCFAYTTEVRGVFFQNKSEPYYNGNVSKNNVSLMINVYWGNEYIESMLKTLKDNGITTTFFVGGSWVNGYPELFSQIVADGHEIGNHGYSHKDHAKLNYEQNQSEIHVCHQSVKTHANIEMTLFAPPSGAFNSTTLDVAKNMNYRVIMWTRDTIDWRDHNTELIVQRATKKMKNGDLILMHPTKNTMEALPQIIDYCNKNSFNITTVSRCLDA